MEFNSYSRIYRYHISSMMDLYILLMEFVVQWWFCDFFLMGYRDTLGMDEVSLQFFGEKKTWRQVEIGDLMT